MPRTARKTTTKQRMLKCHETPARTNGPASVSSQIIRRPRHQTVSMTPTNLLEIAHIKESRRSMVICEVGTSVEIQTYVTARLNQFQQGMPSSRRHITPAHCMSPLRPLWQAQGTERIRPSDKKSNRLPLDTVDAVGQQTEDDRMRTSRGDDERKVTTTATTLLPLTMMTMTDRDDLP